VNTDETALLKQYNRSLLGVFQDWLLDLTQYGILTTIVLNIFVGWLGWANLYVWVGVGLARWLALDVLSSIVSIMKGN